MRVTRFCFVAAMVTAWAGVAMGMFARPSYVPVDRLLGNATAYVQEHPADASGYYTLGRIHYLAFVNKSLVVATFANRGLPSTIPFWWREDLVSYARTEEAKRIALQELGYASAEDVPAEQQQRFWDRVREIETKLQGENWQPPRPTNEELVGHAAAAQWNFYQAISLDPNNALYYLGQASLGEQYLGFLQETTPVAVPVAVRTILLNATKDTYLLAYELAIKDDLGREFRPIEGLRGLVGYEAGNAYIRLWEAEGSIPQQVQDKMAVIKANLATLDTLPPGPITPIVFGTTSSASLADLLAPERTVRFDLDGDGVAEERPWVQPTTGLLAWDADKDGRITSGRELFGSVTWWLFFANGYRAMDMLDDNRDGSLAAGELKGLCVWFDRDSDGQSDDGEVVSVESLDIAAIATRPCGLDGRSPMHDTGIRFKDGRTVPTYDWIAPSSHRSQKMLAQ
jgi:hypothetical protein